MTTKQGWDWEGKYMEAIKADCITYDYIDEDGSKTKDLALPIGWVKEFINIALSHQRKELREKVKACHRNNNDDYKCNICGYEGGECECIGYNKAIDDVISTLKGNHE